MTDTPGGPDTLAEHWHVINDRGALCYGDGTGGPTLVGVIGHWPHGPERDKAIDEAQELMRAGLAAHEQQGERPSWADGAMPEIGRYTESELFVAGSLSTMPPFAGHHPTWALPFARDALEALSRWKPSDSRPDVSPVPLDGEENSTPDPESDDQLYTAVRDAISSSLWWSSAVHHTAISTTARQVVQAISGLVPHVPATPEGEELEDNVGRSLSDFGDHLLERQPASSDLLARLDEAVAMAHRTGASSVTVDLPTGDDLASALRHQRDEIDTLQDDVLRFITQRNLVCERLAARIIPGPDGQDDIDRRRLIREVSEYAWDDVDGWQEMAAKGAMVIAERDRLERELAEARDTRELYRGRIADLASWLTDQYMNRDTVVVLRATAEGDSK